jgi:archaellum component FlaC
MESRIKELQEEIRRLEAELKDREAALPAHSVRPHQLLIIEELEEKIQEKKKALGSIRKDSA